MPKIDPMRAPEGRGTRYPEMFAGPCKARLWRRLGDAAGLTQFGVNRLVLAPGAWSSQRHWHALEDEFVWVLSGEVVMIDDSGEQPMVAGDCAGFPAGDRNGHHFVNRSGSEAVLLVVGSRNDDDYGEYPDIDMKFVRDPARPFAHKDGTPY